MKILSRIAITVCLGLLYACNQHTAEVTPEVRQLMETAGKNETIAVIIKFNDSNTVSDIQGKVVQDNAIQTGGSDRTALVKALKARSRQTQEKVRQRLNELLTKDQLNSIKQLWMINAISVDVPADVIEELSHVQEVQKISLDAVVSPVSTNTTIPVVPEWNLTAIAAQALWDLGYDGQNTVIGSMDTGVDYQHQDLAARWRGGNNSWYDPFGEHATPYDADGHGTHTMGIALGGSAGGTAIGVAPGAKWISARIFNDAGNGTVSNIHQGFQWMLDPDNNPDTDDAPDVINNSWNLQNTVNTCNIEFQNDINILRDAGIAVVFSAGNSGPSPASSVSPANNAGSLATGSVDESLNVVFSSARGPSACNGGIYPQVVAPGFNIRTADITFGGILPDLYTTVTGTSFAAAHVSGMIALLKSAFPAATLNQIETAIIQTSVDVGTSGADNDNGWGVINVANAYKYLLTPVATNDSYIMLEDETISVPAPGVMNNDYGSSARVAVLDSPVSNGTLVFNPDGSFDYTPDADFSGSVSFDYTVTDNALVSNVATVTIDVQPVNDAPIANNDTAIVLRRNPVVIDVLANDTDIDSQIDPSSIVIVSPAQRGTVLNNSDGTITYQSRRYSPGIDSFSYQVKDVEGSVSNIATIIVDIKRR